VLSVILMFILMGNTAFMCNYTRDAYDAAYKWTGGFPGGLAVATLMGAMGFGACSGSSVAATAALGKSVLPEMSRYKYSKLLSAGTIAIGGTIAAYIPPSILLVLYGVLTEVSIGKLLIAGIVPGVLSFFIFSITILVWTRLRPNDAPKIKNPFSMSEKFMSLKGILPLIMIFLVVVGGLMFGVFTPTEAGAIGAFAVFLIGFVSRRIQKISILKDIVSTSLSSISSVFLIVIGAYVFIQFMALSRLPIHFSEWITTLPFNATMILIAIILLYLVLGCILDAIGLILLTVPFMYPAVFKLGVDPIWFGILVVKLVELSLLTPPVGIQAYVLKSVAPADYELYDIFAGIIPFFLVDLLVFIPLLFLFPEIATFLPGLM